MTKPTTETSLLDMPSGTPLEMQVYKPHAACVQVVAVASDGRYKVLHEWTLHVDDLVAQNAAGEQLAAVPEAVAVVSRDDWDARLADVQAKEEALAVAVEAQATRSEAAQEQRRMGPG